MTSFLTPSQTKLIEDLKLSSENYCQFITLSPGSLHIFLSVIERQQRVIDKAVEQRDGMIECACDYWPSVQDLKNKSNQELRDVMEGKNE